MRELATIEELEKRIAKLEQRVSFQDQAIRKIFDFVKHVTEGRSANHQHSKEDQERFRKESDERMNRLMKELGYKAE